ncbi:MULTISPECIES: hypothetical protein [unclassified Colwellia]|uniref:hypothetical protein n=1 Tax=unclassified Colwellia TaxID=196834 RepID=UPI0015F75B33|nr:MULTISPECIES: hypothetical protein [unclassified Colwellia]MBA6380980.1 hypothetical protein [Colwellia sp. BRX10-7]MBA6388521.1 hypothetical protein [Colwellia sp. BRX10-2]MBA6402857.1 hypothetical protein [Colwellia sp. BRX10-5]MBA6407353.1 hypothetical protein [Colwellia sp. BRX10-1]
MKYFISGKVLPERAAVQFSEIAMDMKQHGYLKITCDAGQLNAILDTSINDIVSAKLTVEHNAQMIVSALGFSLNCGYSVEIITVFSSDEQDKGIVFGVKADTKNEFEQPKVFQDSLLYSGKNVYFRMALRDYMRAITDTMDCAFYCYRALEAITKSYSTGQGSKGWLDLHKDLGTNREDVDKKITSFANPVRHGRWAEAKSTTSEQRMEMLSYTQSILLKFLAKNT